MHEKKIFHRDLKSANIFLYKDGTAKVGDMNVSKIAKRGLLYTQTGTPYYASPEVWNDKPYDSKSDLWSLGCVIYEMACLKPPFRAEDMDGLYKRVVKGKFKKLPSHFSVDLNNLVNMMLQVKPKARPSAADLLESGLVRKRIDQKPIAEPFQNDIPELLKTIRLPKNLHYLTDILPSANYEPLRPKKLNPAYNKSMMPEVLKKSNKSSRSKNIMNSKNKDDFIEEMNKRRRSIEEKIDLLPNLKRARHHEVDKSMSIPRSNHQNEKSRLISASNPVLKNQNHITKEKEDYLKQQNQKIEAQIKKYDQILKKQRNYRHREQSQKLLKGNVINRYRGAASRSPVKSRYKKSSSNKLQMFLKKGSNPKMKIFGKAVDHKSMVIRGQGSMKLKPIKEDVYLKKSLIVKNPKKRKKYKLPRLR